MHIITPFCSFSNLSFTILENLFVVLHEFTDKGIFVIVWCVVSSKFVIPYYATHSGKNMMLTADELLFFSFFWANSLCNWMAILFLLSVFTFVMSATIIFMLFHKLQSSRWAVIPLTTVSAFSFGRCNAYNFFPSSKKAMNSSTIKMPWPIF